MYDWITIALILCGLSGTGNSNTVDPAASALVIGSQTNYDRVYKMRYYIGDPSVWAKTIEDRDRLRFKNLGKMNRIDSYTRIAFHYRMESMVWFNGRGKEIEFGKLLLDSSYYHSEIQDVFNYTSAKGGGITVDWVSDNVYWTDQVYQWILMAPMKENPDFHIVLTEGLDIPGDIIVHPGKSLLFWTDYGKRPKIERSDLLGRNRKIIIDGNLYKPIGLEMDYSRDKLYWIDSGKGSIEHCNLNGGGRGVLLQEDFLKTVVGIALFKEYMFAADADKSYKVMYIIPLSAPTEYKHARLSSSERELYDVTIFSGVTQQYMESPCVVSGCTGMCVGEEDNTKHQCLCPWGQELQADGMTCQASEYYTPPLYIYTYDNKLCRYNVWTPDAPESEVQSTCDHKLQGRDLVLGSLVKKQYLFIGMGTSIKRLVMKQGATIENWIEDTGTVRAISVDWLNDVVYWTTSEGLIKMADIDGDNVQTLVSSVQGIQGLVVEPFSKQIFWTSSKPIIEKVSMDGSSRATVVGIGLIKPEHLAVDYGEKRLYWTDSSKGTIESVHIHGEQYRKGVFSKAGSKPFGIAIFQGYVGYTDRNEHLDMPSVKWAYKDGSGAVNVHHHGMRSVMGSIILYGEQSQPQSLYIHTSQSNLTLILLSVLAVIIVILFITVVVGFLLYRRSVRERSSPTSPKTSGNNSPQPYDANYSKVSDVSGNTENLEIAC